jgi:hypothetical protein
VSAPGPADRTPGPSELGDLPGGDHAAAERGDAGRGVDDAPTEPAPAGGPVPEPDAPTEHPEGGDEGDPSEHHRWGDTAYGNAVE